jgi:ribosomal protein L11 methyltransferase
MNRQTPYDQLYIYFLNGTVDPAVEPSLGDDFIGNWVEGETSFLFFTASADADVSRLLEMRPGLKVIDRYQMAYEQWQGGASYPLHVGEFVITPPWLRDGAKGRGKPIILDPGVVFGNGLHPTTQDCLHALSFLWKGFRFSRVADLGTGTGVLAVACGLLGAERVLAVDLNPLCAGTALRNADLNRLNRVIEVVEGNALDVSFENVDLAIGNIHYDVLNELLDKSDFRRVPWIIISGLMRSQVRQTKEKLKTYEIPVMREWDHEMTWYTMLAGGKRVHDE